MTDTRPSRLGTAAVTLAIISNAPILAGAIIFAIIFGLVGGGGSVFHTLVDIPATIGWVVPGIFAGVSLLALVLGLIAALRNNGQRDGITAAAIVLGAPLLAFGMLAAIALFR